MEDDDSIGDDYFEEKEPLDEKTLHLMLNPESRDVAKQYLGLKSPPKEPKENNKDNLHQKEPPEDQEEIEEKVYFSDSEEEKEYRRKKKELEGFQDNVVAYTEEGQMKLLNEQVNEMAKKKNALRDKIKSFLASTFDPMIFSSISRLLVVEMLAYHQNVFERLHQERTIIAVTSCMKLGEVKLALKLKEITHKVQNTIGKDVYPELHALMQMACLLAKHILLSHESLIKSVIRRDTPQEKLETNLTAFEVISFFSLILNYIGFKSRCCFLLSFDKLNLDRQYKLDMFGESKAEKEVKKAKKKKNFRKKVKKNNFVGEAGDNDQEGFSDSEEASVVTESEVSNDTTESAKKMYEYEPLSNSRTY